MQPDHNENELEALLLEEYGAPPLDAGFSADLIRRLYAEAAISPVQTSLREPRLAICLGLSTIAALLIALIGVAGQGIPAASRETAGETKVDSRLSNLSVLSDEGIIERESLKRDLVDRLTLSDEGDRPNYLLDHLRESLAPNDNRPRELSLSEAIRRSVVAGNVSAATAHAGMLYVVDGGNLYKVSPSDGSHRSVGDDDWRNTAAMGAAGEHLYIVSGNRLYEVNPTTEARRMLGQPDWAGTRAILAAGDKLYVVAKGRMHRVNPEDGSYEVLHNKHDGTHKTNQP